MSDKKTFQIGDQASFTKTITETDVVMFAGISGDLNPAHIDEVSSSEGMFKERIAHGMLGASLISAVLGMQLPGPGTIYLSQDLKFKAPVKFNDTVTATVTVKEIDERGGLVLETVCTNQDDQVVIDGTAKVIPPK